MDRHGADRQAQREGAALGSVQHGNARRPGLLLSLVDVVQDPYHAVLLDGFRGLRFQQLRRQVPVSTVLRYGERPAIGKETEIPNRNTPKMTRIFSATKQENQRMQQEHT